MSFLQTVSEYSGLISIVFAIALAIYTARFAGKSKATNTATDAQDKAIVALETRLEVQEKNTSDLTRENARLYLIIDTIKAALKSMGFVVTIDGEVVIIGDGKSSVTTRIHKQNGV